MNTIPLLRINPVIHFIFGLRLNDYPESEMPFSPIHFIAVISALQSNRNAYIIVWTDTQYDRLREEFKAWHRIEVRKVATPQLVFDVTGNGAPKPIKKIAHAADVLRLELLLTYGGIYLDMDTITLRELIHCTEHTQQTIMCQEGRNGLCNAFIMSPPRSEFLIIWREYYYEAFNPDGWGEASVLLPFRLCQFPHMKDHLKVLPQSCCFWPDWSDSGRALLFDYAPPGTYNYALIMHLWESISWVKNGIGDYTFETIKEGKGLYHDAARKVIKYIQGDLGNKCVGSSEDCATGVVY